MRTLTVLALLSLTVPILKAQSVFKYDSDIAGATYRVELIENGFATFTNESNGETALIAIDAMRQAAGFY